MRSSISGDGDRIALIRTYATKSVLQGLSSDISDKFARLGAVTVGATKKAVTDSAARSYGISRRLL